jgi:hypothetical protein
VTYLSDDLKALIQQLEKLRTKLALLELTDMTPYECPKCEGMGRNPKEE